MLPIFPIFLLCYFMSVRPLSLSWDRPFGGNLLAEFCHGLGIECVDRPLEVLEALLTENTRSEICFSSCVFRSFSPTVCGGPYL